MGGSYMLGNRIYIRDMAVDCIIGTEPKERVERQEVIINIMLECDFAGACVSDDLEETVDYKALKNELVEFIGSSSYLLLEKLASEIVDICISRERVLGAKVCVDKPGALTGTRSVAVEVEKSCR
jgi:FolB domain-containing protein